MSPHTLQPLPELPPRYRALGLLGDGATGFVFLARDLARLEDVAFKVVRRNLAVHRRFRARFAREVALSAQVVHPNIVPVHDSGLLPDGRPFVALAYANCGNLRRLMRESMELPVFIELLEQVCDALAALHARGIVHQDLKPANILLHAPYEHAPLVVWVADLGVADDVSELARDARRVGGTPTYMAPEQLQGKPQEVGPWTDLYALGVILYEAICGRRPHQGDDRQELLERRMEAPPPLQIHGDAELPERLHALIRALLDPEPRQRYDRAADVRRELRDIRGEMERTLRRHETPARETESLVTETRSTMATAEAVLETRRIGVGKGLRWNRRAPDPIPPEVPPEHGRGSPASASAQVFSLREIPLIARSEQLKTLWVNAREVLTLQQPRIVLVVGERGAGKTRLVQRVARTLDEGGWMETVTLRYHSPPALDDGYRGAVRDLLAPWNDNRLDFQGRLARWLSRDRGLGLTQVLQEAGHLARWCGYVLPGEGVPNSALGLTFLYRHLESRAWRGGCCLVLEDVENAESEGDGLAIAEALLTRAVGQRSVLVLATVSAEALQRSEALVRQLDGLQSLGAVRVDLPRLDIAETHDLLEETLHLDEDLSLTLAEELEGQPLYARTLLRELVHRGDLVQRADTRFELREGLTLEEVMPSSFDALCHQRLESAISITESPEKARRALNAVALAGEAPPVAVIRHVSEAGLDDLLGAGVLTVEASLVRFVNRPLQRVALRQARSLPNARELHDALAKAWEKLGEQIGLDVDLSLGTHYLRAGQPTLATPLLQRAVRALLAQGSYMPAIRAAELMIASADLSAASPNSPSPLRMDARRLMAVALIESHRPAEAEELLAGGLRQRSIDRLNRARFLGLMGQVKLARAQLDDARQFLSRAADACEALRDVEGQALVAFDRARLARQENDLELAHETYLEALKLTPREGRQGVLIVAGLASVALLRGEMVEARRLVDELAWSAQATGDTRNIAQAHYMRGMLLMQERQLDQAENEYLIARALYATAGDHLNQLNCINNLGEVARFRGLRDEAAERYQQFVDIAQVHEHANMVAIGNVNLALLCLEARDFLKAERYATEASQAIAANPRHWSWLYVATIRAACAGRSGQYSKVIQWWRLAESRGLRQVRSEDLRLPLQVLVDAAERLGWDDLLAEFRAVWDEPLAS